MRQTVGLVHKDEELDVGVGLVGDAEGRRDLLEEVVIVLRSQKSTQMSANRPGWEVCGRTDVDGIDDPDHGRELLQLVRRHLELPRPRNVPNLKRCKHVDVLDPGLVRRGNEAERVARGHVVEEDLDEGRLAGPLDGARGKGQGKANLVSSQTRTLSV